MIGIVDALDRPTSVEPRAKWCGTFLALYASLALLVRCATYGSRALYEFTWACNIVMALASFGMLTGRHLVVQAAMVAVSPDQILWYVDMGGLLATGAFPVGVAKYIFWDDTSWSRVITTMHHLWFLPLCIYSLDGTRQLMGLGVGGCLWAMCVVLSRWLIPKSLPGGHGGHLMKEPPIKMKEGIASDTYLNINCSHEMWKDVPLFSSLSSANPVLHVSRTCVVGFIAISVSHTLIECSIALAKSGASLVSL
ncbi:unnamed protein product [Choristocarpus tenellus]